LSALEAHVVGLQPSNSGPAAKGPIKIHFARHLIRRALAELAIVLEELVDYVP
jgi:hypothetical protein